MALMECPVHSPVYNFGTGWICLICKEPLPLVLTSAGQSIFVNGHHVTSSFVGSGEVTYTLDGEPVDEKGLNAAGFYLDDGRITTVPPSVSAVASVTDVRIPGEHVIADAEKLTAEIVRLRQELAAVKREAVGVVRPLSPLADAVDEWNHEDEDTCLHRLRAGHLRAARAFMGKYG